MKGPVFLLSNTIHARASSALSVWLLRLGQLLSQPAHTAAVFLSRGRDGLPMARGEEGVQSCALREGQPALERLQPTPQTTKTQHLQVGTNQRRFMSKWVSARMMEIKNTNTQAHTWPNCCVWAPRWTCTHTTQVQLVQPFCTPPTRYGHRGQLNLTPARPTPRPCHHRQEMGPELGGLLLSLW